MTSIRPTPEIAAIVALVGDEAALALCAAYAGTRIEVPVRATPRCALARAIGVEATRSLVAVHGGARLRVPLAKRWRILHMRAAGCTYADIARTLGCDESNVARVLADHGMTQQFTLPI